jgi:hypothetical protein
MREQRTRREPLLYAASFVRVPVVRDHRVLHQLARDRAQHVLVDVAPRDPQAREHGAVLVQLGFEDGLVLRGAVEDSLQNAQSLFSVDSAEALEALEPTSAHV